ncbi:YegS/Rv2252/BmrU family lipid kinase [Sediminibacillus dalangtanensis]|uniref:YegS/Rv2252/BmrU family lipid kinase n=1 Tax=Sediminibacillus dalangtanensis TaxID=2729421 RepID=A0ABX7VWZ3_9BACI|nr:diacylglycerol kinase family protein [Sediminibacillus dalangtanensis]QTN00126.1 YegS/Rv2252/BmrU family lipid kinase [Sediminibacillus dalangtanensis]
MYIFIVNTMAANGRGLKILKKLESDPLFQKSYCRSFRTEYRGHAEKLAQQVAEIHKEQVECVIVIGGDGTLHEVVNGLQHHSWIPVAFIPAGSGNDFARGVGMASDPLAIFRSIVSKRRYKSYWPGVYLTDNRTKKYYRHFVNNLGFGLEAEVTAAAERIKSKKWFSLLKLSRWSYLLGLLVVIKEFKPLRIILNLDGERRQLDNVWMITISNHPYFGGGMKINPTAKIQPGSFSVLTVENITRWKLLLLFMSVYWGKHMNLKEVSHFQVSSLTIDSETPIQFQTDGQVGTCKSCQVSKEADSRKIFGAFTKLTS